MYLFTVVKRHLINSMEFLVNPNRKITDGRDKPNKDSSSAYFR